MAITTVKNEVINLMSLVLAIACDDRIVIAADGRSTDFDTKEANPDVIKMFELTNNSAVLVAGNGLIDYLDKYMDELAHAVRVIGHINGSEIARDVETIINRRDWAEWKDDPEKSHMEVIVVGYDDGDPKISVMLDNRDFATDLTAHALGGWPPKMKYLKDNLSRDSTENTSKQANKVSVEVLTKAEASNNREIGGQYTIWHVKPKGIRKLAPIEISKLRNRYGEGVQ
jgi:20S proteasome alpha/beta subunit